MKFRYIISSVVLLCLGVAGCDNFTNINTDPTRLKNAAITQVLTAAETTTAFYSGSDVFLYSSIFTQQGAGSGVTASQTRYMDQYILTNSDVDGPFSRYYSEPLADLNYVRQNAYGAQNNPQHAGIAKLLQAYVYSNLVDCWGSVPYTDAMKGVNNVQPKYDDSQVIYDSLFNLIDGAIVNLGQTNFLAVGSEDLIYSGDITKWTKFGYTLKLRLALHYAKVDGGAKLKDVITTVSNLVANNKTGFMTATTDNFQLAFENVVNRTNPINQFEISRADYYAPGKFFVDMMNTKKDPRRAFFLSPFPYDVTPAAYRGTVAGDATTTPYSRVYTYLRGSITADSKARTSAGAPTSTAITYTGAAPQRLLTFAEYNFIRAEAALIYGADGDALSFLKAGISASMSDAGVATSDATTYLNGITSVDLKTIIEEKYVANFGVPVEPWTDWRRTGFPAISVTPAAAAQGNNDIPRILIYPISEQQTNAANLPVRASMAVKGVFWDN